MTRIYIVGIHKTAGGEESLRNVVTNLEKTRDYVESLVPVPIDRLLLAEDDTELQSTIRDIEARLCMSSVSQNESGESNEEGRTAASESECLCSPRSFKTLAILFL